LTVGVRQALGETLEAGLDLGWVDSGVNLRAARPVAGESLPAAVSTGVRSGRVSYFGKRTYDGHVTLVLFPDVSRAQDGSLRMILSLGAAVGTFAHELVLPESYQSASDAPTGPPVASVLRREVRLETSIGLHWRGARGGVSLAISPWILLHAADPTSISCEECGRNPVVMNFAQTWGVALIFSPAFEWPPKAEVRQPPGS
jgi:hypothetical protein